jgi:hypothetical protein
VRGFGRRTGCITDSPTFAVGPNVLDSVGEAGAPCAGAIDAGSFDSPHCLTRSPVVAAIADDGDQTSYVTGLCSSGSRKRSAMRARSGKDAACILRIT